MLLEMTEYVPVTTVRELAESYLVRAGVAGDAARLTAGILVDADMRGHPSHGVELLPLYGDRIRAGGIDPRARPTGRATGDVTFQIEGHGGLGQLAMWQAVELAAERAAAHGACCVSVGDNNHIGMLAAYRRPFVDHNVVGLIFNVSGPSVAPPSGGRATIGNNALCCVAPSDDPDFPFVVDMATGTVACGKIRVAAARGEPIPEGWLLDRNGEPTIDPHELDDGGAVPVFGGYKGLGISTIVELFAGILGGSTVSPLVSRQRHVLDRRMGCAQLVIGIRLPEGSSGRDIARLLSVLERAVGGAYDGTPPETTFPEQRERRAYARALDRGVPVSRGVLDVLRSAG